MLNKKFLILIILFAFLGFFAFIYKPAEGPVDDVAEEIAKEMEADKSALSSDLSALRYENAKYGFSFDKPEGYSVGVLRDEVGETLLVQNTAKNSGFQIYVTPIDGTTVLSEAQIKQDIPGISIINGKIIKLDDKAGGIMF